MHSEHATLVEVDELSPTQSQERLETHDISSLFRERFQKLPMHSDDVAIVALSDELRPPESEEIVYPALSQVRKVNIFESDEHIRKTFFQIALVTSQQRLYDCVMSKLKAFYVEEAIDDALRTCQSSIRDGSNNLKVPLL